MHRSRPCAALLVALVAILSGCALRPAGEGEERDRAREAGRHWQEEIREPVLPEDPTPEDYVRFASLRNAELESLWWEWIAAIEQIPQDSSFPNLAVPFSYRFGGDDASAWDRTTLGVSNDPMSSIPFPTKLSTAGKRALEAARAAGFRFEAARLRLRSKVLATYLDLALLAETLRIEEESLALLEAASRRAAVGVQAGSTAQTDLLRAQTELDLAQNAIESLRATVGPTRARMNALVGRPASAPVPLPASLPPPRALTASDDELIALAAERSPDLAALGRDVAARERTLSLAKQAWIPDLGLSFSIEGSVSQTVGAMAVLPTRIEAIRAAIRQARAGILSALAAKRQYERDLAASFILNLATVRNDERQVRLFEDAIVPRARQTVDVALVAYSAGRIGFLDLLEAQRTLLAARLMVAQLWTEREKSLAALETWAVADLGSLAPLPGRL